MYKRPQRKVVAVVSVPASIRSRVQSSRFSMLKPAWGSSFFWHIHCNITVIVKLYFTRILDSYQLPTADKNLLHLCQVYVDIITRVIRVPLLLVLLYLFLQVSQELPVVCMDSLMRSWQVMQQARKGIIQLLTIQTLSLVKNQQ